MKLYESHTTGSYNQGTIRIPEVQLIFPLNRRRGYNVSSSASLVSFAMKTVRL